jgi:transmembrane 9 superfamily protein 3
VFIILLIVTICVSVVSTYILLNSEDYRWHWMSWFSATASCAYMFVYSFIFYWTKTHMSGLLQTTHYFASVGVVLFTLALITGAVGALGTRLFIIRIYSLTKAD